MTATYDHIKLFGHPSGSKNSGKMLKIYKKKIQNRNPKESGKYSVKLKTDDAADDGRQSRAMT